MHTLDMHSAPPEDILSLDNIRKVLQRLEDTIVFQLIERAQFASNQRCYQQGAFPELKEKEGWTGSWLQWFLKETECTHGEFGSPLTRQAPTLSPTRTHSSRPVFQQQSSGDSKRKSPCSLCAIPAGAGPTTDTNLAYYSPDEYPFTSIDLLPKPVLQPVEYPNLLWPHQVNVNDRILKYYTQEIVPNITRSLGEDADDGHYGSSAIRDCEVLSALSRRIHFGT